MCIHIIATRIKLVRTGFYICFGVENHLLICRCKHAKFSFLQKNAWTILISWKKSISWSGDQLDSLTSKVQREWQPWEQLLLRTWKGQGEQWVDVRIGKLQRSLPSSKFCLEVIWSFLIILKFSNKLYWTNSIHHLPINHTLALYQNIPKVVLQLKRNLIEFLIS